MKRVIGSVAIVASLGLVAVVNADATSSPHQIGFYCPPFTESFVEGSFYEIATTSGACTWDVGTVPPGTPPAPHYGGLFRGIVGSSTGAGNFMGFSAETVLNRGPITDPQQGEPLFAAIWEVRNGPAFEFDLPRFLNFFQNGSNPPPSNGWGVINWKWGELSNEAPDPVIIIPGILGSQEHNGEWVIDPILHTYDDLIATLDVNAYTPGTDLFTFPYDWRRSNIETAVLLKQRIDEVKSICVCDKVDLVAHSMGGLVARQYVQSDDYEQDVDQLIFLGTPHLGAPKAYLMWEGGEFGAGLRDRALEFILEQEAVEEGYADLFTYVRNKPIISVQQLLPISDYIFESSVLRQYPQGYPENTFLTDLNEDMNNLLNSNISISNIIGETGMNETINGISVTIDNQFLPKWEHGYPVNFDASTGDHGLILSSGDDTVPLSSASFINQNILNISSKHRLLPENAQGEVYGLLTREVAGILVDDWNLPDARLILFKILSPADLLVIAPDGKKIGKENGQEINQIPNAFYTGFNTNTEFITILNPLDGEYKIFTEGTGSGPYTVETAYISEEEFTEASFTGNTNPSLVTELNVLINNENPEVLEVLPTDTEPPLIALVSPESRDHLRSEQMLVNVSAQDGASGVYALETILGTTTIPNIGTVDLFFQKLGVHALLASSTDNVGNATSTIRTFRVIATPDSTLSDIERAYSLGWMTKSVRDSLKKKFNAAIKISKIVEKGTDGKPKGTKVQKVINKFLAGAMLIELQRLRGKGLNEQAYQLLREDIQWLIKD